MTEVCGNCGLETQPEEMSRQPWPPYGWCVLCWTRVRNAAWRTYGEARRDGRLTPADVCEACERPGHVEGHHSDYRRPLDVVWLCPNCHKRRHRRAVRGP